MRSLFDLDRIVDNGEREITTASGEKRVWRFITAPLGRDERGRRMLVTNAVDVTERGRLGRLLAESEARLRLTMEAANFGSWQYDPATGETVWTDKTRELMGVGADEPVTAELMVERVHPDDRATGDARRSPRRSRPASTTTSSASSAATARCAGSRRAAGPSPTRSSARA